MTAQRMAELGLTVIDLRGKIPISRDWQDTPFRTPEELADFEGNFGVLCNGITVIDFDPRNFNPGDPNPDEDFIEYVIEKVRYENDLGPTLEVRTGGGGLHLYYAGETDGSKLGPGVDIKSGYGHQVVGPGSIHSSGEPYAVLPHSRSTIAPVGDILALRVAEAKAEAQASGEEGGAGLTEDGIAEGDRNNGVFRQLAKMWGRGLTEPELRLYARTLNAEFVHPPLPDSELAIIIEQVLKYNQALLDDLYVPLRSEAAPVGHGEFNRMTYADIMALPTPQWLVQDLIPETGVGQIFGPSFSGKTFVALDMAHRVAAGLNWFGSEILSPGPVLYVAMEGGFDFGRRLEAWYRGNNVTPGSLDVQYFMEPELFDLSNMDRTSAFAEETRGFGARMLFLDTQALVAPTVKENDNAEMSALMRRAKELSRLLGCFVWLVHHTGKSSKKDDDEGRGASSQYASVDVALSVHAEPGDTVKTLRATKIKAARLPEKPWKFALQEAADSVLAVEVTPKQETAIVQELLDDDPSRVLQGQQLTVWMVLQAAEHPMTRATIAEKSGLTKAQVKQVTIALTGRGLLGSKTLDGMNFYSLTGGL